MMINVTVTIKVCKHAVTFFSLHKIKRVKMQEKSVSIIVCSLI